MPIIVILNKIFLKTFLLLFLFSSLVITNDRQNSNVIIIYTDDQGTIEANCYGAKDLYTLTSICYGQLGNSIWY